MYLYNRNILIYIKGNNMKNLKISKIEIDNALMAKYKAQGNVIRRHPVDKKITYDFVVAATDQDL